MPPFDGPERIDSSASSPVDAAVALRAARRVRRPDEAAGAVARRQREDVEAARHVAGVDVALVLLRRPGLGAWHDVPAERVAPGRARVLADAVGRAGRLREVDLPGAGAVVGGDELPAGQARDAVEAGRDRAWPARCRCRRCGRRGSCSPARCDRSRERRRQRVGRHASGSGRATTRASAPGRPPGSRSGRRRSCRSAPGCSRSR